MTLNLYQFLSTSALSGSASEFAEKVLDQRYLGPQTYGFVRVS